MPLPNEAPKFLQVYFIDSQQETATRMNITSGLKQNIVQQLSLMLHHENHLQTAQEYFCGHDTNEGWKVVIYEEKQPRTEHVHHFNRPSSDEIGILMPNESTDGDTVLHYYDGHLDKVSDCTVHMMLYSTHYCFLMVCGMMGTTST